MAYHYHIAITIRRKHTFPVPKFVSSFWSKRCSSAQRTTISARSWRTKCSCLAKLRKLHSKSKRWKQTTKDTLHCVASCNPSWCVCQSPSCCQTIQSTRCPSYNNTKYSVHMTMISWHLYRWPYCLYLLHVILWVWFLTNTTSQFSIQ